MSSKRRRRSAPQLQRISGPAELLQAVPYLLGFRPSSSLVLVGLTGGLLMVTARLDLSDAERGVIPHTLAAFVRSGCSEVVGVVYDDEALRDEWGELPWADLAESLESHTAAVDCELIDVLLVAHGRWWSYGCAASECCPFEGNTLPDEPSSFAAEATYRGVSVLPSRAALEALLDPLPDEQRAGLDAALEAAERAAVQQTGQGQERRWELSVKRALFGAARGSDRPGWPGLDEVEVLARFGVALATPGIRNALWLAVDGGRLDGRPLWRELARRLPSPYDVPPLFLFGWASWRAGDGALAGIAAERALVSDPSYTAADLLLGALTNGVDPRQVPKLRLPRSA